ncbi:MAG: tripartite tricarboxylate transporter TctB family protein [Planctomycetota bacterium]|jgi:hypothetical protein
MGSKNDIGVGLLFLLLSMGGLSFLLPGIEEEASFFIIEEDVESYTFSPKMLPRIALGSMALFSFLSILSGLKTRKQPSPDNGDKFERERLKPLGITLIISVAYVALFAKLGFCLMTFISLLLFFSYFRLKGWKVRIGISLGFTLLMYVLFAGVMGVQLPRGLFGL